MYTALCTMVNRIQFIRARCSSLNTWPLLLCIGSMSLSSYRFASLRAWAWKTGESMKFIVLAALVSVATGFSSTAGAADVEKALADLVVLDFQYENALDLEGVLSLWAPDPAPKITKWDARTGEFVSWRDPIAGWYTEYFFAEVLQNGLYPPATLEFLVFNYSLEFPRRIVQAGFFPPNRSRAFHNVVSWDMQPDGTAKFTAINHCVYPVAPDVPAAETVENYATFPF